MIEDKTVWPPNLPPTEEAKVAMGLGGVEPFLSRGGFRRPPIDPSHVTGREGMDDATREIASLRYDLMEARSKNLNMEKEIAELSHELGVAKRKIEFWEKDAQNQENDFNALVKLLDTRSQEVIRLDTERQTLWEVIKLLSGKDAEGPGETDETGDCGSRQKNNHGAERTNAAVVRRAAPLGETPPQAPRENEHGQRLEKHQSP